VNKVPNSGLYLCWKLIGLKLDWIIIEI